MNASEHRSFKITPEKTLSRNYRIGRIAIVIYFFTLFVSSITLCDCSGFFVVMAVCALVAMIWGTRWQRIISIVLLAGAVAGFITEFRDELRIRDRVLQVQKLYEQKAGSH